MDDETVYCSNCKRDIPKQNFLMHQVHCIRNIILCPICEEPVPRIDLKDHQKEAHSIVKCPLCSKKVEQGKLADHKRDECMQRMVSCPYCNLEVTAADFAEHENYCGSRTEVCPECGEYVILRFKKIHLDTNHGFLKLEEELPNSHSLQATNSRGISLPQLETNPLRPKKVLNAIQDHSRPCASGKRLSPVKRTNDMPQVNAADSVKEVTKALDKATLKDFEQPDVEMDRLFALRLQSEDYKSYSQQSRNDWSLFKTEETPSQEQHEQRIPCEFCDELQESAALLLHQTDCIQNPTQLANMHMNLLEERLARTPTPVESPLSLVNTRPASPPADIWLPCEFCNDVFTPRDLNKHQLTCDRNEEAVPHTFFDPDENYAFDSALSRDVPFRRRWSQSDPPNTDDFNDERDEHISHNTVNLVRKGRDSNKVYDKDLNVAEQQQYTSYRNRIQARNPNHSRLFPDLNDEETNGQPIVSSLLNEMKAALRPTSFENSNFTGSASGHQSSKRPVTVGPSSGHRRRSDASSAHQNGHQSRSARRHSGGSPDLLQNQLQDPPHTMRSPWEDELAKTSGAVPKSKKSSHRKKRRAPRPPV